MLFSSLITLSLAAFAVAGAKPKAAPAPRSPEVTVKSQWLPAPDENGQAANGTIPCPEGYRCLQVKMPKSLNETRDEVEN